MLAIVSTNVASPMDQKVSLLKMKEVFKTYIQLGISGVCL
jgi:hypothetical protein